jgi:hypothetical protein
MAIQPVIRELTYKLRNYNDQDFLLFTGDPLAIALAAHAAAELNNGRLQVLKFDRFQNDYYLVKVDLADRQKDLYGQ